MSDKLLHGDVTDTIINSFYHVYNSLGYGFLEKVYENALIVSLSQNDWDVKQQWPITVSFEQEKVGDYFVDLVVDDSIIVEIKAAQALATEHEAQLINYLKATGLPLGLIVNFGSKKLEWRRYANTKSSD